MPYLVKDKQQLFIYHGIIFGSIHVFHSFISTQIGLIITEFLSTNGLLSKKNKFSLTQQSTKKNSNHSKYLCQVEINILRSYLMFHPLDIYDAKIDFVTSA